jgi:hypothetical protein
MKEGKDYTFLYNITARSMKFKSEYNCFQSPFRLHGAHSDNIALYDTEETGSGAEIAQVSIVTRLWVGGSGIRISAG